MLRCLRRPTLSLVLAVLAVLRSLMSLLLAVLAVLRSLLSLLVAAQAVEVPNTRASSSLRCCASQARAQPLAELLAPWTTDISTLVFPWVTCKGNPGLDSIYMEPRGMIEWMFP